MATDSIVASCGLANFERTSSATRVSEQFGDGFAELYSMQNCDRFPDSFVTNCPQLRTGRTVFMIVCRPFLDLDNDKTLRRHIEFHPRILRSVLDADDYREIHRDSYPKEPEMALRAQISFERPASGRKQQSKNEEESVASLESMYFSNVSKFIKTYV